MHFTDPKDQRIKQLENENKIQQDMIKKLKDNVEALTQAVLYSAKKRFGASSEKTQLPEQYTIWGEETGDRSTTNNAQVINIKEQDNSILDEYLPWSEKMQLEFRIQNTGYDEDEKGELQSETA